jgi:CMP/dCMP kinase
MVRHAARPPDRDVVPVLGMAAQAPSRWSVDDASPIATSFPILSKVAVIREVRAALVDFQRAFARRAGGAVLDGRDIGTVICPEAEAKLFVTASAEVRATRRWKELTGRGIASDYDAVLADVKARDARDMDRAEAPLRPAGDAVVIDTSGMGIDAAVAAAIAAISAKGAGDEDTQDR